MEKQESKNKESVGLDVYLARFAVILILFGFVALCVTWPPVFFVAVILLGIFILYLFSKT